MPELQNRDRGFDSRSRLQQIEIKVPAGAANQAGPATALMPISMPAGEISRPSGDGEVRLVFDHSALVCFDGRQDPCSVTFGAAIYSFAGRVGVRP